MAELVFSSIGQSVGSALLPNGVSVLGQQVSGAAIGQFVGSLAGAAVDSYLFASHVEGPRIADLQVTQSREGAPIPDVFGRMRIGGNVIWAARFQEQARRQGGGKGGPSATTYAYSLSFAVGLCEGEVSQVTRIWANGEELDLAAINWRLYSGRDDQAPDALIEAIEGKAPAYRGLAYVVFEDLPLEAFGNRMPQLSFEVVRPGGKATNEGRLEQAITSVNLIPGSGEFAYATDIVRRVIADGEEAPENQHSSASVANFTASLDQLVAELPNLEHVNLIVGWFGTDLRCGACEIHPGVEISEKSTRPMVWNVAGVGRANAYLVSQSDGRANYGGTPTDDSVIQAIQALKARGIRVTLYPFVFMDVEPGNGLPDPYGGEEQAAFPWRGRITCAAGTDLTAGAADQVADFFGNGADWRYKRFILHYAGVAQAAGGVDAFLIGSEMVGMTRVRSGPGQYPAVAQLADLAEDVRAIIGAETKLSYAADWTEYGAHAPPDGSGDVGFPLDEVWAHPDIDFVGVDWYPPLSDWREGATHLDKLAGARSAYDLDYLVSQMEAGEAFDWYYASQDDRDAQARTQITDGAYEEPWIYRQKDIRSWAQNAHYPRVGGVRSTTPTSWTPGSKPLRFVEFGVPAVDKGANQPNVFYDPKSSENALPHYSNGARDDLIQRRVLEAFIAYWRDDPLIDQDGISIWAWDMRPFPYWPLRDDIWGDGDNWRFGHWLNGRTGAAALADVVADLFAPAGVSLDASQLDGLVAGYARDRVMRLRGALEPLRVSFDFHCAETPDGLVFKGGVADAVSISQDDIASIKLRTGKAYAREDMERDGRRLRLNYIDAANNHASASVLSWGSQDEPVAGYSLPLLLDPTQADVMADVLRDRADAARNQLSLELGAIGLVVEPGDILSVDGASWKVREQEAVLSSTVILERVGGQAPSLNIAPLGVIEGADTFQSAPDVVVVDAPPLPGEEDDASPFVFAYASPWTGALRVSAGVDEANLTERAILTQPCVMGRLLNDLPARAGSRWIDQTVEVEVKGGVLSSKSELAVLNGANAAFIETGAGWEMIQFQHAELIGANVYRLERLLRGQQGSDAAREKGAVTGARILFLGYGEQRIDVSEHELDTPIAWRAVFEKDVSAESSGDAVWRAKALNPWKPAHFQADFTLDTVNISWVRRVRKRGDNWALDIPSNSSDTSFCVEAILNGEVVRSWKTLATSIDYDVSDLQSDYAGENEANIRVWEMSPLGIQGLSAELTFNF